MKTWMRLKEINGCHLTIRMLAGHVVFLQSYGMQYESENPLSEVTLGFFPRKSRRSQWRTRWKISPRHYGYGKGVPRQVDLKYVGTPLLDTEVGCTWRQILAIVTGHYIIKESFCLFHSTQSNFCTYKFLCNFETLPDRKILYTYLTSV